MFTIFKNFCFNFVIIFNKKGDDDFVEIAEVIKSYLDKSETHYMNAYGNNN